MMYVTNLISSLAHVWETTLVWAGHQVRFSHVFWWGWLVVFLAMALYFQYRRDARVSFKSLFWMLVPKSASMTRSFYNDVLICLINVVFLKIWLVAVFKISDDADSFRVLSHGLLVKSFSAHPAPSAHAELVTDLVYSFGMFMMYEWGWFIGHYLFHKIPFLWAFHKVHHSATFLNPLNHGRFHVFETLFLNFTMGSFQGLNLFIFHSLGYAPSKQFIVQSSSVFVFLFLWTGALRHSNIPLSFGKLEYLFSSPRMHQLHHSRRPEHIDKNFGLYLSLFDVLFGTLYLTKAGEELDEIGLAESGEAEAPASLLQLYFIRPFRDVGLLLKGFPKG